MPRQPDKPSRQSDMFRPANLTPVERIEDVLDRAFVKGRQAAP